MKISCISIGEKDINDSYLEIINDNKIIPKKKKNIIESNNNNKFLYLFFGDVFGNLLVYQKSEKNFIYNDNNVIKEIRYDKIILNDIKNYTLMKTLTDHTSEIKYIDYNPRLNLLVDYALDGYINLYTMPTLKLVRSIQTRDLEINDIINYVVLISNPFPMICCITITLIFFFDINGQCVNKYYIPNEALISICVDKNCGLYNDSIIIKEKYKEVSAIEQILNEK